MRNLFIIPALLISLITAAQDCTKEHAQAFQKQINSEYANPKESPLLKEDIKNFRSLEFYPIDLAYCVQ